MSDRSEALRTEGYCVVETIPETERAAFLAQAVDATACMVIETLHATMRQLWVPLNQRLFDWMKNPQAGDLVMETSTMYMSQIETIEKIGRLLGCVRERVAFADDTEGGSERAWYIALADGRVYRWNNADFVRIPEGGLAEPGSASDD